MLQAGCECCEHGQQAIVMAKQVNQGVNNKEVEHDHHLRIEDDIDDAAHCRCSSACTTLLQRARERCKRAGFQAGST